jgi:hypothetical protein
MTTKRLNASISFAVYIGVLLWPGLRAVAGQSNREIKSYCSIQRATEDKRRDGPVDCKVFLQVTSTLTRTMASVECQHRTASASADWSVKVGLTNDLAEVNTDKQLLAGAILLALDALHRDYQPEPVGLIYLEPGQLPNDFSEELYAKVAAQMRGLDSEAKRFDDPKVRQMVRNAYGEMGVVRYIRSRLDEEGFDVKIDTAELCCLRRSLKGVAWKDIANEPAVGLNLESLTCCFVLDRTRHQSKRVGSHF